MQLSGINQKQQAHGPATVKGQGGFMKQVTDGILSMLAAQDVYAAGGQLGRKVGVTAAVN